MSRRRKLPPGWAYMRHAPTRVSLLLDLLAESGGVSDTMSLSEKAQRDFAAHATSRMLSNAEIRGWVDWSTDDAGVARFTLTEKGRRAIRRP